jgi:hypothetical protein
MGGSRLVGELDYLRRAFRANALEHTDEAEEGAAEWKHAVAAARSAADGLARLERLAGTAQSWRWEQRAEDIFWELAKTGHSPRWVLDALWALAASRTDTEQLQQVAGYLAKADPRSVTARNNYTFLCLLTHSQEGDPHRAAFDAGVKRQLVLHVQINVRRPAPRPPSARA